MSWEDTTRGDASRAFVRREDGRHICRGVETCRATTGCLESENFGFVLRGGLGVGGGDARLGRGE